MNFQFNGSILVAVYVIGLNLLNQINNYNKVIIQFKCVEIYIFNVIKYVLVNIITIFYYIIRITWFYNLFLY